MQRHRRSAVSTAVLLPAALLAACSHPPVGAITGRPPTTAGAVAGPSAAALMICGDDVRMHVQQALRLPSPPVADGTWTDHRYTCTYRLPMGPLVLSVSEAHDDAGTVRLLSGRRQALGSAHDLIGLGPAAYGNEQGIVVLRKDHDVLDVDASHLPPSFGPEDSRPADFAYEIASDVLGCWTGDE